MIKDNQTRLNRLHVLLDALVIAAAYVFSWFITLKSGLFGADPEAGILPTWFYMRVLYKWNAVHPDQALKGATAIFGGGIAHMIDDIIPGCDAPPPTAHSAV